MRVVRVNRSKRANHLGTAVEKRMAEKRRFELERATWHDARFGSDTPVESKSTMHEHADGQPGNWKVYRKHHEKPRRYDGWYCFVVYRPRGRLGLTILQDKMVRSSDLPLLRWHDGGDHRGTEQAKIAIDSIFNKTAMGGWGDTSGWSSGGGLLFSVITVDSFGKRHSANKVISPQFESVDGGEVISSLPDRS